MNNSNKKKTCNDRKDARRNRNNYSKSGQRSTRSKDSRVDGVEKNEMGISTTNDLAWYSHYPELTVNAGKLSMLYPAGMKIDFRKESAFKGPNSDGSAITNQTLTSDTYDVPGIMAIRYAPTYGFSDSIKSPLTQMSRTTFNHLVAATNRVPSYEYTDLTVYQIAMTSLIQFYYWMCRIYLVAGTYDAANLTWNKAVFAALDVNGTDIIKNRSLLYSYILTFARRISAFPFPKSFDLFNRTAALVSNIYADGTDPKDQLYVFCPVGAYRWDTDDSVGASKLTFVRYTSNMTYADITAYGNALLDAVQGSSDVQLMTADILKVYSNDLVTVNIPPENGSIAPVYDPMILTQIMNAKWVGPEIQGLDITQATDNSVLEPYMVSKPFVMYKVAGAPNLAGLHCRDMVNFLVSNPSEGTVLEGTRFKFTVKFNDSDQKVEFHSFGSEIVESLFIYTAANATPDSSFSRLNLYLTAKTAGTTNFGKLICALTNFDWHPRVIIVTDKGSGTWAYEGSIWDCSNYAFITDEQIELMNNTALYNLMLAFG